MFRAPQLPFKFAIAISGFKSTAQYYQGFYSPIIKTPSLHVIADWDTIVEASGSEELVLACEDTEVIRHIEAHIFPTSVRMLHQMAEFIQDRTRTPPSFPDKSFLSLQTYGRQMIGSIENNTLSALNHQMHWSDSCP